MRRPSEIFVMFLIAVCEITNAHESPGIFDYLFINPTYEDFYEKFIATPNRGVEIILKNQRNDKLITQVNFSSQEIVNDKGNTQLKKPSGEKKSGNKSKNTKKSFPKLTDNTIFNKTLPMKNAEGETCDVTLLFDSQYKNFNEAFSEKFKMVNDIWMVLGNRGDKNYYRERFSSNWIYWDFNVSDEALGISGNFFDIKNWKYLVTILPRKLSYIAADYNELLQHRRRNLIIKTAASLLQERGIFCLEDTFNYKENEFEHFSNEDFEELSHEFEIHFANWDGFIASLPYTSYTGSNRRTGLHSGIETMILKLAAAGFVERKELFPDMSLKLNRLISQISEEEKSFMVKDIINSESMRLLVKNYKSAVEEQKTVNEDIEKLKTEIKELSADIENSTNLINFNKKMKNNLGKINQGVKMIQKGAEFFGGEKHTEETGVINKLSDFFTRDQELQKLEQRIAKNKEEQIAKKRSLLELETQSNLLKQDIEQSQSALLKLYDILFDKFEEDTLLKTYVKYKKKDIKEIVEDNDKITDHFLSSFDEYTSKISTIEKIAQELENSWSPKVILNNLVEKELIKTDKRREFEENSKVLIVLIKK